MPTVSKPDESSPFKIALQDYPLEAGRAMKQFMVLATSSLIVASIAVLIFNLTNFSLPAIDFDALALEFATRCQ